MSDNNLKDRLIKHAVIKDFHSDYSAMVEARRIRCRNAAINDGFDNFSFMLDPGTAVMTEQETQLNQVETRFSRELMDNVVAMHISRRRAG